MGPGAPCFASYFVPFMPLVTGYPEELHFVWQCKKRRSDFREWTSDSVKCEAGDESMMMMRRCAARESAKIYMRSDGGRFEGNWSARSIAWPSAWKMEQALGTLPLHVAIRPSELKIAMP